MKTILKSVALGVVLTIAPVGFAHAACGIGTQIWEGNNGTGAKILASITNFWTFKAISTTFEVAGCTASDNLFKTASNAEVRHYASSNLDHLVVDMARGQGDYLDALSGLLELQSEDRARFRTLTQQQFPVLVPHDHVTAGELLATLGRLMSEDEKLARYIAS